MKELPRLLAAYTPSFRAEMQAGLSELQDAESVLARAALLPEPVRNLLDVLLLSGLPGEAVDPNHRARIDTEGLELWRGGFLLPRTLPSRGSTIDPRYYAASCRLHPALVARRPLAELLRAPAEEPRPSWPPGDARSDAVVVSAAVEAGPPTLTQHGLPRKDQRERLLAQLGPDTERWELALRLARATGLARPVGGRLEGFPEARPRRLTDPTVLLPPELQSAGRTLLKLVHEDWLELSAIAAVLEQHAPDLANQAALERVADAYHRVAVIEASRDATGVVALRTHRTHHEMPPGFLLTPDLDILVGAAELQGPDYGRLCRMAPYLEGDRVHRHRLTRQGVAADLAVGNQDPLDFLGKFSRTGVPLSVQQSVEQWARAAERVSIRTGVTIVEEDGELRRVDRGPAGRVIDYAQADPPPASFRARGMRIEVPFGKDPLTLRGTLARVATLCGVKDEAWQYQISARRVRDPDTLLERLRELHDGPQLPAALEVSVLAANGLEAVRSEDALLLHLPLEAAEALRRDEVIGPLIDRRVSPTQVLVSRTDMETVRARLHALGVSLS